jgi:hypothetical protein
MFADDRSAAETMTRPRARYHGSRLAPALQAPGATVPLVRLDSAAARQLMCGEPNEVGNGKSKLFHEVNIDRGNRNVQVGNRSHSKKWKLSWK